MNDLLDYPVDMVLHQLSRSFLSVGFNLLYQVSMIIYVDVHLNDGFFTSHNEFLFYVNHLRIKTGSTGGKPF